MAKDLVTRLAWMFGLLLVYKFGAHVPMPGVDSQALSEFFRLKTEGTVFSIFNMFSGGALGQMAILGLGIGPYISSSIIFQILTVMSPKFERLQKDGEEGRRKIAQYTRYLTVAIALVQGYIFASQVEAANLNGQAIVETGGLTFRLMTAVLLTSGAMFTMWLGEQITDRGIGNGASLLIYVGIASSLLPGANKLWSSLQNNTMNWGMLLLLLGIMVAVIAFIVFFEQAQRRVPIQYARRQVGRKVYGGQDAKLPLKINAAGVIPPIFASTLIYFPATLLTVFGLTGPWAETIRSMFSAGNFAYNIFFVIGIVFFCFFYTAVTQNPNDMAENLRKSGAYVPGIRPGRHTAQFFDTIITRLTFIGAIYLSAVCVLPTILINQFRVDIFFGGTSLLILVGVALDTMSQIQSHLLNLNYEGFIKEAKLRGRGASGAGTPAR